MKYKLLIIDFNGVLSNSRFYSTYSDTQSEHIQKIRDYLFDRNQYPLIKEWMRGNLTYNDVHRIAIEQLALPIDISLVDRALEDSIGQFSFNEGLLDVLKDCKGAGAKLVICSDNMDIFREIIRVFNSQFSLFDSIYSSADHKMLKEDNDGEIFLKILKQHTTTPEESVLIDDSYSIKSILDKLKINFFHFNNYENSHTELKSNLLL